MASVEYWMHRATTAEAQAEALRFAMEVATRKVREDAQIEALVLAIDSRQAEHETAVESEIQRIDKKIEALQARLEKKDKPAKTTKAQHEPTEDADGHGREG